MAREKLSFEVLVVGSGPAAAAAGHALVSRFRTGIVHRSSAHRQGRYGEHLAPEARQHLRRLGLIDLLSDVRHRPSYGILSAWGADQPLVRDYVVNPHGCGVNLDRVAFDQALFARLGERGASLIGAGRLERLERMSAGWELTVATEAGPKVMTCRLLIDASGRAAAVSRRLGRRRFRWDRLVALFARLEAAFSPSSMLIVEALSDGWWYSVPLADGSLVLAFMTDSDLVPDGAGGRRKFWLERLDGSALTKERAQGAAAIVLPDVVPAMTQTVEEPADEGFLAIGDASAAFDPLAAASLGKAFEDGLNAADTASAMLGIGEWSPEAHVERVRRTFARYLELRRSCYRQEQRWPSSVFWQRRHEMPHDLASSGSLCSWLHNTRACRSGD